MRWKVKSRSDSSEIFWGPRSAGERHHSETRPLPASNCGSASGRFENGFEKHVDGRDSGWVSNSLQRRVSIDSAPAKRFIGAAIAERQRVSFNRRLNFIGREVRIDGEDERGKSRYKRCGGGCACEFRLNASAELECVDISAARRHYIEHGTIA